MTMDYSPWVEREIWPFLKVAISLKPERSRPPKLVYMYVTSTPICMYLLGQFRSIKLLMTMDYSPWVEREIWPFLRGSIISETGEVTPTKIGAHACDINPYLHKFFEPIPID